MRTRIMLVSLLVVACSKETPDGCSAVVMKDPLECITPLPAMQSDGTPWPSYSERLAELQSCRDGSASVAGYILQDQTCADGKHALATIANLGLSSFYYYQAEELIGVGYDSDLIQIDCNGCSSDSPQGTLESVTCDVVATTRINCSEPDAGHLGTL